MYYQERLISFMMGEYLPDGWFWEYEEYENPKGSTIMGRCYSNKRITLSPHAKNIDVCSLRNLIRHEVAHAYAGVETGHGWRWIWWYVKLGGRFENTIPLRDMAFQYKVCRAVLLPYWAIRRRLRGAWFFMARPFYLAYCKLARWN